MVSEPERVETFRFSEHCAPKKLSWLGIVLPDIYAQF
jgi:hypothetical protein